MFGIKVQMVKDNRGALEVEMNVDRFLLANCEALRSWGSKNLTFPVWKLEIYVCMGSTWIIGMETAI